MTAVLTQAPARSATLLMDCPVSRKTASTILGEPAIGFRAVTEHGPICHDGCLAPGSSPHSHSTVLQWMLVGATGIAYVDAKSGIVVRSSSLHAWSTP